MFKKINKYLVIIGLTVATSLCPKNVEAQETAIYNEPLEFYKEGKEYFRLGNYPLAQQHFRDALRFREENIKLFPAQEMDAAYLQALSSKMLGKDDAVYELTNFIEEYGNNRRYNSLANYHLAELFFNKKSYRPVLANLQEVYENDLSYEEYENYLFMTAYSHFVLQEFQEAKEKFARVAKIKGKHFEDASYYTGYLAFEEGDYQAAVKNFFIVEDVARYSKILPYYISQIYYRTNQTQKLMEYTIPKLEVSGLKYKTQMHKMVGLVYYDQKNFEKALPYLSYFVERSTKVSKEDLYLLAYTQYQFGDYEKAIPNFLELNTLDDEYGQNAMYHLADCYLKVNDKEKARTAFKAASELNNDASIKKLSAFNYAKLTYELGFHSDAIVSFRDFIKQYPNDPEAAKSKDYLGELFEVTKNYNEALEVIDGISSKTPALKKSYQRIAYAKAIELYTGGKTSESLTYFDKTLTYPMDNKLVAYTHFWKGNIYSDKKEFGQSIQELTTYLNSPSQATDKISPAVAHYNIAYIYFSQKKYDQARTAYNKSISAFQQMGELSEVQAKMYPDALLRSGDCSFILRDYSQAKKQYETIVKKGGGETDYALFQTGMLAGLQQDNGEKIKMLEKIGKQYPNSYYADDALFQIASTHALTANYSKAINTYNQLLQKYPKSKFVPQATSDLGLMYYNLEEYGSAITYYEKVINQYPKSQEAQTAALSLKEVYIATGDPDAYFDYLRKTDNVNLSTSAQDTILYQFAESFYEKGDCQKAISSFNKYITEHPRGAFTVFAYFYRGDCMYQSKNYRSARSDFDYVLKQSNNLFTEKALMRAARIAFVIDKNDQKAYQYYKKLYGIASQPEITTEALKGITKASYNLGKDSEVIKYGNLLVKDRRATKQDKLETNFILAKLDFKNNQKDDALKTFETVAKQNTNEAGAEARYLIAKILYDKNQLDKAKDACFRVDRETPAQEFWVVKSYLLLGDIFMKKGDVYQAKATVKSIVDNYRGDKKLEQEAKAQLNKIIAKEKAKSKLEEEESNDGEIDFDEDN